MKTLEKLQYSEFDQNFLAKATTVRNHLLSNIKPLELNGLVFDGETLSLYIEDLVK
jgi:hypothetical protein